MSKLTKQAKLDLVKTWVSQGKKLVEIQELAKEHNFDVQEDTVKGYYEEVIKSFKEGVKNLNDAEKNPKETDTDEENKTLSDMGKETDIKEKEKEAPSDLIDGKKNTIEKKPEKKVTKDIKEKSPKKEVIKDIDASKSEEHITDVEKKGPDYPEKEESLIDSDVTNEIVILRRKVRRLETENKELKKYKEITDTGEKDKIITALRKAVKGLRKQIKTLNK